MTFYLYDLAVKLRLLCTTPTNLQIFGLIDKSFTNYYFETKVIINCCNDNIIFWFVTNRHFQNISTTKKKDWRDVIFFCHNALVSQTNFVSCKIHCPRHFFSHRTNLDLSLLLQNWKIMLLLQQLIKYKTKIRSKLFSFF